MGCARQPLSLFMRNTYRFGGWKRIPKLRKVVFADSLHHVMTKTICRWFGHKPYQDPRTMDANEYACSRCHRFCKGPKS